MRFFSLQPLSKLQRSDIFVDQDAKTIPQLQRSDIFHWERQHPAGKLGAFY